LIGGPEIAVVGIGTVDLPVKRDPNATGPQSHGILRLHNVLHIPTIFCNVIGNPISKEYGILTGGPGTENTSGVIFDKQHRTVAYFDPQAVLFEVKLSDPPVGPAVGPSPFVRGAAYYINVRWADSEREKWEASRAANAAESTEVPPLSDEEKQWLKKHWDGEFKFLASHGLSIYKDEDREEGRIILRAIMAHDRDGNHNDRD